MAALWRCEPGLAAIALSRHLGAVGGGINALSRTGRLGDFMVGRARAPSQTRRHGNLKELHKTPPAKRAATWRREVDSCGGGKSRETRRHVAGRGAQTETETETPCDCDAVLGFDQVRLLPRSKPRQGLELAHETVDSGVWEVGL